MARHGSSDYSDATVEVGLAMIAAGAILLVPGIWIADVTPDKGPWIGSWLDGLFRSERGAGWTVIGAGIVVLVFALFDWELFRSESDRDARMSVPPEHRASATAQRLFNPPYRPKPDWGQTLRGVGVFAALVAVVWYLAGAPRVGRYDLGWLRCGFDAYGSGLLVLVGTFFFWGLLTESVSHSGAQGLLRLPLVATIWVLSQVTPLLGAAVVALVTHAVAG